MTHGICKLTGKRGTLVRAHILPLALTDVAETEVSQASAGEGTTSAGHWCCLYDDALVTAAGEQILAEYDDNGTKELRRQRLVWSGWGPAIGLGPDHLKLDGSPYGLRRLDQI